MAGWTRSGVCNGSHFDGAEVAWNRFRHLQTKEANVDDYEASSFPPQAWYGLYGPMMSPLVAWEAERLAAEAEQLDERIAKDRKQAAASRRAFDRRLARDRTTSDTQRHELDERVAEDRQHAAEDGSSTVRSENTDSSTAPPADTPQPAGMVTNDVARTDNSHDIPSWERDELLTHKPDTDADER